MVILCLLSHIDAREITFPSPLRITRDSAIDPFPGLCPQLLFLANFNLYPFPVIKHNYVLKKTLESPLDCKEIQPVHPKEDQSWVFVGRTGVEAETPLFGHLMRRADSFEKTLMLGKIEGRRRRG